jgi:hypothetical protein
MILKSGENPFDKLKNHLGWGRRHQAVRALRRIAEFFEDLPTAEQSTAAERWCRILSQALVKYLHGRQSPCNAGAVHT